MCMLLGRCVGTGPRQDRRQILEHASRVAANTFASRLQLRRDNVKLALEQSPDVGQRDLRVLARVAPNPELAHLNRLQVAGQLRFQESVDILLVQGHLA